MPGALCQRLRSRDAICGSWSVTPQPATERQNTRLALDAPIAGRRCACAGLRSVTFVAVRRPGRHQPQAKQAPGAGCCRAALRFAPAYVSRDIFCRKVQAGKAQPPPGKNRGLRRRMPMPGGAALCTGYVCDICFAVQRGARAPAQKGAPGAGCYYRGGAALAPALPSVTFVCRGSWPGAAATGQNRRWMPVAPAALRCAGLRFRDILSRP